MGRQTQAGREHLRRRADAARAAPLLLTLLLGATACGSGTTGPEGDAVPLPGASSLVFQGTAAQSADRAFIESEVRRTYDAARARLPLDGVMIIIRHGSAVDVIPQIGFGGRANQGTVTMTIDPGSAAWTASREAEFARVFAHELHHVGRFRTVGFDDSLLEAMVNEGLADQFMIELEGGPPPIWAVAVQGAALETLIAQARQEWHSPSFDRDEWFFNRGGSGIPFWAGYAIGFELTRRYLVAHPEARASSLLDEPATSFEPE